MQGLDDHSTTGACVHGRRQGKVDRTLRHHHRHTSQRRTGTYVNFLATTTFLRELHHQPNVSVSVVDPPPGPRGDRRAKERVRPSVRVKLARIARSTCLMHSCLILQPPLNLDMYTCSSFERMRWIGYQYVEIKHPSGVFLTSTSLDQSQYTVS